MYSLPGYLEKKLRYLEKKYVNVVGTIRNFVEAVRNGDSLIFVYYHDCVRFLVQE